MSDETSSRAGDIMRYSFLVAFANDGTLAENEVRFMKNLALEDGVLDAEEKRVFQQIFYRIKEEDVSVETWSEIQRFRKEFDV